MSLLKQSILAQISKGETVLNSFDANDTGATEGFVYQCRWAVKEYDPATASGFDIVQDDLLRYTTVDGAGDPYTAILKAAGDFNLILNGDIAAINTEATDASEITAFDAAGFYKKNGQYFQRKYGVFAGPAHADNTVSTDAYTDESIFVSDKALIPALLTETVTSGAFTGGAHQNTHLFTFPGTGGFRKFTRAYFGMISATSVVPNDSWFYYAGDDIGGGTAPSAAGYYLNSMGASLDFSVASVFTDAVYADQTTVVNTGAATYVWSLNTGSTQVVMSGAQGYSLESVEVADVLDASQAGEVSNPTATNTYWTEVPALSAPLTFVGAVASVVDAATLDITTANDLSDAAFWNLLSENFIEDTNQSVGSGGVSGANAAGKYASTYVANTASTTVLAHEIESFISATSTTDATINITNHGLTTGDNITISNVDATYNGGYTVEVVTEDQFRLDATSGFGTATYSGGGIATESGSDDLLWKEAFPPVTDQTLLYRY